ncbi:MAG: aldehyde dehydrogenase family protein [Alphaproteobacteria bacterium]|nr:aldehyde dehydrogenase family protein [Alphaproteobacteria bacterium]
MEARAGVPVNEVRTVTDTPVSDIEELLERQRRFFESGRTLTHAFRDEQLRSFESAVRKAEARIAEALWADLHKSETETWVVETSFVLGEIAHARKHLKGWMKPRRSIGPVVVQPARSAVYAQPLGTTLILGAWNYPFHLTLAPLVAALAGGNVAVLKPSELSPATSAVIAEVVAEAFDPAVVACVQGGIHTGRALLQQRWDHLCYTGGPGVGKLVAQAGAEHFSRVTLELGGKSPCIVMPSANLETAARRIAWGKWINAGQTCVAPDYLLVHRAVHDDLVERLGKRVRTMFGDDPQDSPDYGRLVNARHFERVKALVDPAKVAFGGRNDPDERYLEPTILTKVTADDPVMQEEIFGPVLPVITVDGLEDAFDRVRQHPDPLAAYLFSEDAGEQDAFVQRLSFGGGCVNHATLHLADPDLPFGGIRGSGLGAYHGLHGFQRFTHAKGVLHAHSSTLLDLTVKYAPYAGKLPFLKRLVG